MRFSIGPCKTAFSGTLTSDELEGVQMFLGEPRLLNEAETQSWNQGRRLLRLMFLDAPMKGSITIEE